MSRYKNPWHKPRKPEYGPEYYETDVPPSGYRGYLIFQRVKGSVWDVVKDGVCITQMAGASGAMLAIDKLLRERA